MVGTKLSEQGAGNLTAKPVPSENSSSGEQLLEQRRRYWLPWERAKSRIEAFHGYGSPEVIYVRGRVRSDKSIRPSSAEDPLFRNVSNLIRRMRAQGVARAKIQLSLGGQTWETETDAEGFFEIEARPSTPLMDGMWHPVEYELLDKKSGGEAIRAEGLVLVPSFNAEFGVISDIDDTVLRSDATRFWRMIRTILLSNAHTRMPFAGVNQLYKALQLGPDGQGLNPMFYVSSSPWNLYDLLDEFFRVHKVPPGPLFLRSWEWTPNRLLRMDHKEHKLAHIRKLFKTYPSLSWILIGDSGQQDPEIYREVVREYPKQVLAIYIRDVTTPERDKKVNEIAASVRNMGVEMLLVQEKSEAAQHAVRHGWIREEISEALQLNSRREQ